MEHRDNEIAQIATQLVKGRLGLLIGAGMSVPSAGIPGSALSKKLVWKALFKHKHVPLDPAFEEQLVSVSSKYPLEAIAEACSQVFAYGEHELQALLENVVFPDGSHRHAGHTALASIVNRYALRTIYTTNWDTLLEDAIGTGVAESITESDLRRLDEVYDSGHVAVVHLHGTFTKTPLVREPDLMDPEKPLFQLFLADLIKKAFVFVGYSLSDPNIRALYWRSRQMLSTRDKQLNKLTYVVSPAQNDVERRTASAVWHERGARYIPMGAEDFFAALQAEAATHALSALKDDLRRRLNVGPDELRKKIDQVLVSFPEFGSEDQVLFYLAAATRGASR
jgi:hypothetical protein